MSGIQGLAPTGCIADIKDPNTRICALERQRTNMQMDILNKTLAIQLVSHRIEEEKAEMEKKWEYDGEKTPLERIIIEVDADCNITYSDGKMEPCEHQPKYTFCECGPGYGSGRGCPKYDYYNQSKVEMKK